VQLSRHVARRPVVRAKVSVNDRVTLVFGGLIKASAVPPSVPSSRRHLVRPVGVDVVRVRAMFWG